MSIDVENAFRITEQIAFPRLVGSEGEKKAQSLIKKEFEKICYTPVSETFQTDFSNWIMARYLIPLLGIVLFIIAILFFIIPWLSGILSLVFVAGTMGFTRAGDINLGGFGKKYTTENIYGKLETDSSKQVIVFMGHYDTKSQTFPLTLRVIVLIGTIFGALITSVLILIGGVIKYLNLFLFLMDPVASPTWNALNLTVFIFALITVVLAAANYFNKIGNDSPGAIDNGVSLAVVLELARFFKENQPKNLSFIFLIPGSEELNLGGARAFIKQHESELDKENTLFINFDGVGTDAKLGNVTSYGLPRKIASKRLKKLFEESAEELNIPYENVYLPVGAWSDFMPVLQKGFEACWLESMGAMKDVHTKTDDMSKVSRKGIEDVLRLTIRVVEKLAES
ncbi:MAG: M28 family metallopeptidase [Candidatus Helarchaeota archaeon]